jgi:hypothetical protein
MQTLSPEQINYLREIVAHETDPEVVLAAQEYLEEELARVLCLPAAVHW